MARYKVYSTSFDFEKPLLLNEDAFLNMKKGLPIYPQPDDVTVMVLKKYWWYIIALFPPIFIFLVLIPTLHGGFEPYKYANALKKKNKFYNDYYNSIYTSKNYTEYCNRNKNLSSKKPMSREERNRIFGY